MTKTEALEQVETLLDQSSKALESGERAKQEFSAASTDVDEAFARVVERLRLASPDQDRFVRGMERLHRSMSPATERISRISEQLRLAIPRGYPANRVDEDLPRKLERLSRQLQAIAQELERGASVDADAESSESAS